MPHWIFSDCGIMQGFPNRLSTLADKKPMGLGLSHLLAVAVIAQLGER